MLASRIASLFTRTEITKNPEPTKPKLVRDKSSIEDKRTAASVHVNQQLDDESTKNIKCQFKKRPMPNSPDTQSEKLNTAYQFKPNYSKTSESEAPISETNTTPKKSDEDWINSRSDSHAYTKLWDALPESSRELGFSYGLVATEMAAIRCYSGKSYEVINSTLLSLTGENVDFGSADSLKSFKVNEHLSEIISDAVNGMKKLPPDQISTIDFNGLGRDVTLPDKVLNSMKEGEIISPLMFTSTTQKLEQLVENEWWHNREHVVLIHQRVGGNGRDISAFSEYKHESEILFLPGTKFKITIREDKVEVGQGGNWKPIYKQLNKAFFDAFPEKYVDQLDYKYVLVNDALGESYPLNFELAAKKMEEIFPDVFFIKSATNEKNEDPGKITINLEDLHSLSRKLHAEEYGGAFEPGTGLNKIVIAMQEISPDEELKINLEKSQATAVNEITPGVPSNTPSTSQSERKIPVRGQKNTSGKTEGKIPLKRPNTKSGKTERKIPVRDQNKTTAQPNTAAKPSSTNKPNLRNDDYSIGNASNYDGEYFPGFRE
jgi:hypothetical protein